MNCSARETRFDGFRLVVLPLLLWLGIAASPCAGQQSPPSATWSGRVVDGLGVAIEGASISCVPFDAVDTARVLEEATVRSGLGGAFRVRAEGRSLYVAARGYAARIVVAPSAERDHDLGAIMLRPGAVLAGFVVDEKGERLVGVRVCARQRLRGELFKLSSRYGALSAATTDARGAFVLPCAPTAGVFVSAQLDGYAMGSQYPVALGSPLRFELGQTGVVSGRVVDHEGSPRACEVDIGYEAGANQRIQTNDRGEFTAFLQHTGRFRVSAPGWGVRWRSAICEGPTDDVVVAPAVARDVDGEVVRFRLRIVNSASGEPVSTATVWHDWEATRLLAEVSPEIGAADFVRVDNAGAMWITLPAVRLERRGVALVRAPGYATHLVRFRGVNAGDDVKVELSAAPPLRGRLVADADGTPLGGALVWATSAKRRWLPGRDPPRWAVTTNADGRFEILDQAAGAIVVQAFHEQWEVPEPVELVLNDETGIVEMRARARPSLRIEFEDLPKGEVFWLELSRVVAPNSDQAWSPRPETHDALVPKGGVVELPRVRLGTYSGVLRLGHEGPGATAAYGRLPRIVVDQSESVVKLPAPALRHAVVTGVVSGELPLERLVVEAHGDSVPEVFASCAVDHAGRYGLVVPSLDWALHVVDLGTGATLFQSSLMELEAESTHALDVAIEAVEVHVDLVPAAARSWISGVRFVPEGGVSAEVRVEHGSSKLRAWLLPGRYSVEAQPASYGKLSTYGGSPRLEMGSATVEVGTSSGQRVELRVRGRPTPEEIERRH